MKTYYVYIMASISRTLYIGITSNLFRRVEEHKDGLAGSFTSRYQIKKLIYYETYGDVRYAIEREKQLKGWRRSKKVALIESINPAWKDLSLE